MSLSSGVDILVVGAGPVGLMAALDAQRLGLSVRVIDDDDKTHKEQSQLSSDATNQTTINNIRCACNETDSLLVLSGADLEFLNRLDPSVVDAAPNTANDTTTDDLVDEETGTCHDLSMVELIQAASILIQKVNIYFDQANHASASGGMNLLEKFSHDGEALYIVAQHRLEHILQQYLNSPVEYQKSIVDHAEQTESKVNLTLRHADYHDQQQQQQQQHLESLSCKYVLVESNHPPTTRRILEIEENLRRHMDWCKEDCAFLWANVLFSEQSRTKLFHGINNPNDEISVFPSAQGLCILLPLFSLPCGSCNNKHPSRSSGNDHMPYRLIVQADRGMKQNDITLDTKLLEQLLFEQTGVEATIQLANPDVPPSIWEWSYEISDSYRHGRIFLMGNAAVELPGFLTTTFGIQNVSNLLWKLAWVERCLNRYPMSTNGVQDILQSYHTEQRCNVMRYGWLDWVVALVDRRHSWACGLRNFLGRIMLQASSNYVQHFVCPSLSQSNGSKQIILSPRTWYWHFNASEFLCRPGQRIPNFVLSDGTFMHQKIDKMRHTWVFINHDYLPEAFALDGDGLPWVCACLRELPAPSSLHASARSCRPQVILVRPDLFVAGAEESYMVLMTRMSDIFNESWMASM